MGAAYAFRGIAQMIFTSTHLLKLALVWILIEGIPAVHFRYGRQLIYITNLFIYS
jgi:hypothetical protein